MDRDRDIGSEVVSLIHVVRRGVVCCVPRQTVPVAASVMQC